jgi:hypothetical protein
MVLKTSYLIICDELLLDDLHGVDPLRLLQLDHQDFGVTASTDDADQLEVVQRDDAHIVVGVGILIIKLKDFQVIKVALRQAVLVCEISFFKSLYGY